MKRQLTEQQEKFVSLYVATGNAKKSAEIAGYAAPKQKGYDLKKRFATEIEERTRSQIGDNIPGILKVMQGLAFEAESEAVRLNACKDLLDRAGYKPVEKQVVDTVTHTVHELSTEELEQELERILGKGETVQ